MALDHPLGEFFGLLDCCGVILTHAGSVERHPDPKPRGTSQTTFNINLIVAARLHSDQHPKDSSDTLIEPAGRKVGLCRAN